MLGIPPVPASKPLPQNYGYGMTGNFSIPIPEKVLTRDSPVVQQNMHLMDKLGRVPVMPVNLPAPLEKPTPGQAIIWPAQKSDANQEPPLMDPFASKNESLPDPFGERSEETAADPFAEKDIPMDPFAEKQETPILADPFKKEPDTSLPDPFAEKESTPDDPFAEKPEENPALTNPFAEKPEISTLPDPFAEKPEEISIDSLDKKQPTPTFIDPFTEKPEETSDFFVEKQETSALSNPFKNPDQETLTDPFAEKPEISTLPDPFAKKPEETVTNSLTEKQETSILTDPFKNPDQETLTNPFTKEQAPALPEFSQPQETTALPNPFSTQEPHQGLEEKPSLPDPFGNSQQSSPFPEQSSPSEDLFASLSPVPDSRQVEIDTIFDTSNTQIMKRPSQTLADIHRASTILSTQESPQSTGDPFANVSTPLGGDLFTGMTSPEISDELQLVVETPTQEKSDETPVQEKSVERKPLSRMTPGTLLPADSPEDLRKAAEAIGVNMEEPETPMSLPHEIHTVDVVKYFQEDEEFGSDEDDGRRLRVIFDNMLPVVDENPVIPEPEEMAEQVICKARALLTMLDSLKVSWTQQKKKKRLIHQVNSVLNERCYSEIGYDIKVCEK